MNDLLHLCSDQWTQGMSAASWWPHACSDHWHSWTCVSKYERPSLPVRHSIQYYSVRVLFDFGTCEDYRDNLLLDLSVYSSISWYFNCRREEYITFPADIVKSLEEIFGHSCSNSGRFGQNLAEGRETRKEWSYKIFCRWYQLLSWWPHTQKLAESQREREKYQLFRDDLAPVWAVPLYDFRETFPEYVSPCRGESFRSVKWSIFSPRTDFSIASVKFEGQ